MTWTRLLFGLMAFTLSASTLQAQSVEEGTVEAASEVLREIMEIPARSIPTSLLAEAYGVAIIPGMIKGGFIVGVRHGKGVVVSRDASGAWITPVFITVTGGSIGWQAGLQATDVIIVFRNRGGVENLMRGKFIIGADASVAAGPVGREAAAATDGQLKAEILSYSRSRGLFAGVAIDGASMQVDHRAMAAYYALRPGQPMGTVPTSAIKLVQQIAAYAGPMNKVMVKVNEAPVLPQPSQAESIESVAAQLAESSVRLNKILDPQWKDYLALPGEIYARGKLPPTEVLDKCLSRYQAVSGDARYQNLSSRHEFQETNALLVRYRAILAGIAPTTLKLPPPPGPQR